MDAPNERRESVDLAARLAEWNADRALLERRRAIKVDGADVFHAFRYSDTQVALTLSSGDVAVVDAAAARLVLAKLGILQ